MLCRMVPAAVAALILAGANPVVGQPASQPAELVVEQYDRHSRLIEAPPDRWPAAWRAVPASARLVARQEAEDMARRLAAERLAEIEAAAPATQPAVEALISLSEVRYLPNLAVEVGADLIWCIPPGGHRIEWFIGRAVVQPPDWLDESAEATGVGRRPRGMGEPQGRLLALRAARVDAMRNLVAQAQGLARFGPLSRRGRAAIHAYLEGARAVREDYDPATGLATVTIEAPLEKIWIAGRSVRR